MVIDTKFFRGINLTMGEDVLWSYQRLVILSKISECNGCLEPNEATSQIKKSREVLLWLLQKHRSSDALIKAVP